MADVWTIHRWWVPDDAERPFTAAWQTLAETLTGEGLMQRVSLFADIDEPQVRWTPLRWASQSARRAWRADAQHRCAEDSITAHCDGIRVHRVILLRAVDRR